MMVMALGETCWNNKLIVHFCTPDEALVVQNKLSFYIQILSQFVEPPSDTLLRIHLRLYGVLVAQNKFS
jgi:hypothetical protein